jgi:hypothetical protein
LGAENLRTEFAANIKPKLAKLLAEFPEDKLFIMRLLDIKLSDDSTATPAPKTAMVGVSSIVDYVLNQVYTFDKTTLIRVRKCKDMVAIRKLLTTITHEFITIDLNLTTANMQFPNIYVPCADSTQSVKYCARGKLVVNKPIDELIDILAHDIVNPLRAKYLLNNPNAEIIVDYFKFEEFPNENVRIFHIVE